MSVAANGPNTEILQFDWFISGRIFPVLLAQEEFKKSSFCRIKNKIFNNIRSENVLRTIRIGKVTM